MRGFRVEEQRVDCHWERARADEAQPACGPGHRNVERPQPSVRRGRARLFAPRSTSCDFCRFDDDDAIELEPVGLVDGQQHQRSREARPTRATGIYVANLSIVECPRQGAQHRSWSQDRDVAWRYSLDLLDRRGYD